MLFNIHTRRVGRRAAAASSTFRASVLPEVRSSSEIYGETAPASSARRSASPASPATSRPPSSARLSSSRGMAKNTYGTGCFMLMNIGDDAGRRRRHKLLTTVAWQRRRPNRLRARRQRLHRRRGRAVAARRTRHHQSPPPKSRSLAATVPDSGGVYLVPAFAGLGAPHWDQYARGTITGLTRGTTAGHIARAALEGIAFQVADVLDVDERRFAASP